LSRKFEKSCDRKTPVGPLLIETTSIMDEKKLFGVLADAFNLENKGDAASKIVILRHAAEALGCLGGEDETLLVRCMINDLDL